MKKAVREPPFLVWNVPESVVLDGGQAEVFPVLHAATIPFDLVGRVAEFQQVADVVGGLAAPHAVAEQDDGFGVGEVEQAFGFLDAEGVLHEVGNVEGAGAPGRVESGPGDVDGGRDGASVDPVRGARVDEEDGGVAVGHSLCVVYDLAFGDGLHAGGQGGGLDAEGWAGTGGLGERGVDGVLVVGVALDVDGFALVLDRYMGQPFVDVDGFVGRRGR